LLPNSIRALIVGPSNWRKTNVMISSTESPNVLKFQNIYICSKSLYHPKLIKPIKGMNMFTFSDKEKVLSPDRAKPHSIMIFDDVICDKQTRIRDYFCMGRHKHIDSFYICPVYFNCYFTRKQRIIQIWTWQIIEKFCYEQTLKKQKYLNIL